MAINSHRLGTISRMGFGYAFLSHPSPQIVNKRSYVRSGWEELFGRKMDPAVVEKLEEGLMEYRILKMAPNWLPLIPSASYWVPSQGDTMKELQVAVQRMRISQQLNNERGRMFVLATVSTATVGSSVAPPAFLGNPRATEIEIVSDEEEGSSDLEEDDTDLEDNSE
eukprot:c23876_g1_i2 orf=198-698(-)